MRTDIRSLVQTDIVGSIETVMSQTTGQTENLDERMVALEKELADLRATVLRLHPVRKDWRSTFGTLPHDDMSREADRLGREYREQQREP